MLRARRAFAVAGAGALMVAIPVSAALAADATGCKGVVTSKTAAGAELDTTTVPGPGGSSTDPFVIDPAGTVDWKGSTNALITDGTWAVRVGGIQVMSGEAPNGERTQEAAGTVKLGDTLAPVQWVLQTNAIIPVDGELTGDGGSCTGSGYVAGTGGGTFTSPVFLGGVALAGLGILGALAVGVGTKATAASAAAGGPVGGGA